MPIPANEGEIDDIEIMSENEKSIKEISKPRIMIVDDEEFNTMGFRELLEIDFGENFFEIFVADSG